MREPVSAKVENSIVKAAKERAESEGVSLSAVIERALDSYLSSPPEASNLDSDKPAQPIADKVSDRLSEIESRLSQLESASQSSHRGRKGKRRR